MKRSSRDSRTPVPMIPRPLQNNQLFYCYLLHQQHYLLFTLFYLWTLQFILLYFSANPPLPLSCWISLLFFEIIAILKTYEKSNKLLENTQFKYQNHWKVSNGLKPVQINSYITLSILNLNVFNTYLHEISK